MFPSLWTETSNAFDHCSGKRLLLNSQKGMADGWRVSHSGVWTILLYFTYKTACLSCWEVYSDCVEAQSCVMCIRRRFTEWLCCFVKSVESRPFALNKGVLHVLFSVFSLSASTVRHNHRVVSVLFCDKRCDKIFACVRFRPSTFKVFGHVCLRYVYIYID